MATSAEDAGVVPQWSGAAAGGGEWPAGTSTPVRSTPGLPGPAGAPGTLTAPAALGTVVVPDARDPAAALGRMADAEAHELLARTFDDVVANVRTAYIGRDDIVRLALCCLMAEGHLLVEDHPGVGKTTLAKALARSLGLDFGRVQFTADLLPADVTGAMVFDRDSGRIAFRPGPVFTNVLLADELNRASPKAQSALLESMEERQVSADGVSHPLPRPFMVLATQNPFDAAGTFPLPHSQRDRFLLRLRLGYPDRASEDELLATTRSRPSPESLSSVGGPEFLARFADAARRAHVGADVRGYVLDLIGETRSHPDLTVGASPRATLAVLRAAAAVAVSTGRGYVTPDDVKLVAEPALGHRVVLHPAAELAGVTPAATIAEIMSRLVVPVGGAR
ncbi:MAG TPA: AAA family ATPase [Acidimicrobiales bacterium]|nr:AAA family ATPase [Acidimicrobiales bacterium]